MLAMMCLRKVPQTLDRARVQDYTLEGRLGRDVSGCTVGVVGTGSIGGTVIRHLKGFGCKILAYDLYPNDRVAQDATYVELDELLAQSDVVTLHAPLTKENRHMIDDRALALMKPDAVLVNTARGALIDTVALIGALEDGRLGGVALDVLEREDGLYYADRRGDVIKNREMAVLRSFPNVILTPMRPSTPMWTCARWWRIVSRGPSPWRRARSRGAGSSWRKAGRANLHLVALERGCRFYRNRQPPNVGVFCGRSLTSSGVCAVLSGAPPWQPIPSVCEPPSAADSS